MRHDRRLVSKAIEIGGGPTKVGIACGVSKQAVCQWVHHGVSGECVEILAELSGIPKDKLRPPRRRRVMTDEAA